MCVFLDVGAAPGGVNGNNINSGTLEDFDNAPRCIQCLGFASGVRHQCAAASLFGRHNNFATQRGEHANGCRIHITEQNALHATQQHANPQARVAL